MESPELSRLRAAVESAPTGLLVVDGEGRIVLTNREVERLFGYTRDELLGMEVERLVPKRVRAGHPAARRAFAEAPSARAMGAGRDLFGQRKDGSSVPLEIGLTPVETPAGLFIVSSVVDITARLGAAQRFRIAVESSPNGMLMTNAAGELVLVNREIERMFDYPPGALLGRSIETLVPERFRGRHAGFRAAFFAGPRSREMGAGRDLYAVRRDGSEFPVEIGLNPIETDDGVLVLGSVVDISARRRGEAERATLEQRLRSAQRLESLGRLAGGIAHDFNNILATILSLAELAADGAAGPDGQPVPELSGIVQATNRGRDLVQRILLFSRGQEGTVEPVDFGPAVVESTEALRRRPYPGVELRVVVSEPSPVVCSDRTSIHQIVTNLVTNAALALPAGGTVFVKVDRFVADAALVARHPGLREASYGRLLVRDDGVGMDEATRERCFEPFFTTRGPREGTGLGLAMVHGLVGDQGGAVWIESELGKGTTVTCLLPLSDADPVEDARADTTAPAPSASARILYVDDDVLLGDALARILRTLGYEVTVSHDPREALAAFTASPAEWDVVISDFKMPRLTGIELARSIRRVRPDLPVLLLTGQMDAFPPADLERSGIVQVVSKPVTRTTLARILAEVVPRTPAWR